jgi:hypothetical protein
MVKAIIGTIRARTGGECYSFDEFCVAAGGRQIESSIIGKDKSTTEAQRRCSPICDGDLSAGVRWILGWVSNPSNEILTPKALKLSHCSECKASHHRFVYGHRLHEIRVS